MAKVRLEAVGEVRVMRAGLVSVRVAVRVEARLYRSPPRLHVLRRRLL